MPNSSRINNRNLKSAKDKTNQNPNNKLNNTNNTINNTNNSNLSTINNQSNINNNFDNVNNLNESVSGYFLGDGVADQMEIPYLNNPTPTATKKTNQKENNFANKNNNNNETKNLKAKSNLSSNNNNNNTLNNFVSNSVNISKLKSKSRVKSSNKRYSNLTENENAFNDFILNDVSDDVKRVSIKTDANNNNNNNNKVNNSNTNGAGNKISYTHKNSKIDESENISKKLPRDSKSPNIRNYRTKRNINSISLNESNQAFSGIGNNQDNTPSNLKKIQVTNNSSSNITYLFTRKIKRKNKL